MPGAATACSETRWVIHCRVVKNRNRACMRFRIAENGLAAYCSNYAERDGFVIPLEPRLAWYLRGGEREYLRGTVRSMEYDR
jgi:hypothetical protein